MLESFRSFVKVCFFAQLHGDLIMIYKHQVGMEMTK